jgi:DNA-directed RNA polymerase subunit RPC12/RpoP
LSGLRLHYCPGCLRRQLQIDRLTAENARLKARLRYQERNAKEAPFGSSTPSAKLAVKPNSLEDNQKKKGGAKVGHAGFGRTPPEPQEITRTERVMGPDRCPHCGTKLLSKGFKKRTVIEAVPARKEIVVYELEQCDCPGCRRVISAPAPGVFAKGLFGNRLLAYVAQEHYVEGATMGRLARQLGLPRGSLWGAMHQLAARLESVLKRLLQEYRRAPVKHADETGWRQDGQNGYAWLFCTLLLSLFRFRQSRSAQVAREVFGPKRLPGTLVVDRYAAYRKLLCRIQYCFAHLLREVQDLGKEFAEQSEVQRFVEKLAPLLAQAMKLRTQGRKLKEFRQQAATIKAQIVEIVQAPAQHPGIQKIQNIFRENARRLYHWTRHPSIPAENNQAERELRPLVIARKISFGSQSPQGLHTREVLMSVLHTLKKRSENPFESLTKALDALAAKPNRAPYALLFNSS